MLPGGMNPKQMRTIMKRMGIKVEEINATRVVIECPDRKIIVEDPNVMLTKMPGSEMFQVSGNIVEEGQEVAVEISEEDIKMVAEQSGVSLDEAKAALEETNGDLAEAIIKLKG